LLDPLLLRIIATGLALLFIPAAVHKFSHQPQFAAQLAAYQIVPVSLLGICSLAIPVFELLLGIAWLMSGLLGSITSTIAISSAFLLGIYTFGITVNLLRGRTHIDCGCSLTTLLGDARENNESQNLSYWLLLRNSLLIGAALAAALPATARSFAILDYFSLLAAVLSLVFIYAAYNQLMTNNNSIRVWRNPRG